MSSFRIAVFTAPLALLLAYSLPSLAQSQDPQAVDIFDGKSFNGWEGDIDSVWRIEDGALTAGSLKERQKDNNFLATKESYSNFELELEWKLQGTEGFINGGVQFRTKRIPNHHEVSGYQADLGAGFDGALYDESRRNKILQKPDDETLKKALRPLGEWNHYRIRAKGNRIELWLNGFKTVDYTEEDPNIPQDGIIAIQIHGGATSVVQYRALKLISLEK
jgi:Domain of Unknown Function (DUF1080)